MTFFAGPLYTLPALACAMRFLGLSLNLSLLVAGFSLCALAQVQNLTDAQRVDLAGPVKSVFMEATTATAVWSQPSGPTLVLPIWCHECEFDPNGNRTKFGQIIDGRFQGETVHLFFAGQGNVTERVAADAERCGPMQRRAPGGLRTYGRYPGAREQPLHTVRTVT
jgi:hypothetical protein